MLIRNEAEARAILENGQARGTIGYGVGPEVVWFTGWLRASLDGRGIAGRKMRGRTWSKITNFADVVAFDPEGAA